MYWIKLRLVQSICETIVQNVVKAWNLADMSQRSYQSLLASDPILKFKMADVAVISKWPTFIFFGRKLEITVEKYCIDKFWWNLVHSLHIIIKSISLLHTLEYWKPSLMVAFISLILVFEIFPLPIIPVFAALDLL